MIISHGGDVNSQVYETQANVQMQPDLCAIVMKNLTFRMRSIQRSRGGQLDDAIPHNMWFQLDGTMCHIGYYYAQAYSRHNHLTWR